LSNIKFDYNDKLELYFPQGTNVDIITGTYENLLAKFKTEGKFESYKKTDIEYQRWQASRSGTWGKMTNFLNHIWWNYSYSKGYIIWWTIGLLFFFLILNCIWWKKMQEVYPIVTDNDIRNNKYDRSFRTTMRRWVAIALYTSLIFFSLKIDFEKLNLRKSRYIFFFFIQYLVGLVCVFFIANAILKI